MKVPRPTTRLSLWMCLSSNLPVDFGLCRPIAKLIAAPHFLKDCEMGLKLGAKTDRILKKTFFHCRTREQRFEHKGESANWIELILRFVSVLR